MKRRRSPSPPRVPALELDEFWTNMLRPHLDPASRVVVRRLSRRHYQADPDHVHPTWMSTLYLRWRWVGHFDWMWDQLLALPRVQRDHIGRPRVYYTEHSPAADDYTLRIAWRHFNVDFALMVPRCAWECTVLMDERAVLPLLAVALERLEGETDAEHSRRFRKATRESPSVFGFFLDRDDDLPA